MGFKINKILTLLMTVAVISVGVTFFQSSVAFADYTVNAGEKCQDNTDPKRGEGNDGKPTYTCPGTKTTNDPNPTVGNQSTNTAKTDDEVTCAIEKIGWILCPVMEVAGKATDKLFSFLADNVLEIEPELFNVGTGAGAGTTTFSDGTTQTTQATSQNGTYRAWSQAKDIANVAFIVAFVVIVISQVTSFGITNYGIKRMLPRLIVAAIAVNVSYFICQAIVDISNILGYNLYEAMKQFAASVGPSPFSASGGSGNSNGGSFSASDGFAGLIVAGVLATAGAVFIFITPLGATLLFVIVAVATTVILLLLRKVIVVILVVVSPVAFVLYLLPNTEPYFKKWLTMLWKLLLIFPIIAMLLGGGQLASAIILSAGTAQPSSPKAACNSGNGGTGKSVDQGNDCEGTVTLSNGKAVSWSTGIIALVAAIGPVLLTMSVASSAFAAAGVMAGKIGSTVSKVQGATNRNRQKEGAKKREYLGNKIQTGALTGRGVGGVLNIATGGTLRRSGRRQAKYKTAAEDLAGAQESYNRAARRGQKGTATDAREMLETRRQVTEQKLNAENISAQHLTVDTMDTGSDAMGGDAGKEARELIAGGNFDSPRLAALLEHLSQSNHAAFMAIAGSVGGHGSNLATQTVAKSMGSAGIYAGSDIAKMSQGRTALDLNAAAVSNAAAGGMSASGIATTSNHTLEALSGAIRDARATGGASAVSANAAAINIKTSLATMSTEKQDEVSQKKRTTINGM